MQKRMQALLLTALMVWTLAAPISAANPFFDVPEDHWAYDAISYLAEAGLVEGYPDGTFGGSRNFTRYEMALVFARIVANFEKHIDELIEQGIESRLEDLTGQVSAALETASNALEAASGTSGAVGTTVVSGDASAAAALRAAEEAKEIAGYALDVAVGILDAIDARGWDERIDAAEAQASEVASEARAALEVAKQAQETADEAVLVAVGILDAIDARDWDARIDRLSLRTDETAAQAAEALRVAQEAQKVAQESVDIAVGILDIIDARDWDARIDAASDKAEQALALARRIAAIDDSVPSVSAGETPSAPGAPLFSGEARAAIEEIAAAVVMDKLQSVEENAALISSEVKALRTDVDAANALIASEANRLEQAIAGLTTEFASELEILGVRVARLETKFTSLEDEVLAIRTEMDRVRISGTNTISVVVGSSEGDEAYKDPRDEDSGKFDVPSNKIQNRLQLRMDAKPSDDVTIVAEGDLVVEVPRNNILRDSRAYVEATTDQPIRVIRLGSLDADRLGQGFVSHVFDADRYSSAYAGGFVNYVSGAVSLDGFAAQSLADRTRNIGVAGHVQLNPDMDATVTALRYMDGSDVRTAVGVGTTGDFTDLKYDAYLVFDLEEEAKTFKITGELPVEQFVVQGRFERIDPIWNLDTRLPFAAKVDKRKAADADKFVDINGPLYADERLIKARVDVPVSSFMAFAQAGTYHTSLANGQRDTFTQYGVYDLNLFSFDVDAMRSRFVDRTDNALMDQRMAFATKLEDIDLKLELHKQWTELADTENHFMLSLASPIQIVVPWTGSLQFGNSFTAANPSHAGYKLALTDYEVGSDVSVNAEISGTNNVIDDGKWRDGSKWSGDTQFVRSIDAIWNFAEPMNLLGGYKVVDRAGEKTVTQDAGLEYVLDAFGGDLKFGYGYRIVRVDGAVDGSGRSLLNADFSRTVGDFTLDADATYVIGGTISEDGNEYDTKASLQLAYPVFTGADFTVDGKYVSSKGDKVDKDGNDRPEYSASSLTAGLKFTF